MIKTDYTAEDTMSLDGLSVAELISKARTFRQQGQNKKAIETFQKVLEKEPENLDILNEMGMAHIHIGEQSDAINALLASKTEWCNGYWHGEAGMLNINAVLK